MSVFHALHVRVHEPLSLYPPAIILSYADVENAIEQKLAPPYHIQFYRLKHNST